MPSGPRVGAPNVVRLLGAPVGPAPAAAADVTPSAPADGPVAEDAELLPSGPVVTDGVSAVGPVWTEPVEDEAELAPPTWTVPVEPVAVFPPEPSPAATGALAPTVSPRIEAPTAGAELLPLTCKVPVERSALLPPPICTLPVELEALFEPELPIEVGALADALLPAAPTEAEGFV